MIRTCRAAFTLLELLTAIAIVAVLVGLLLAAVQAARATAVRVRSVNQLRQLSIGLQHFASTRNGRLTGLVTPTKYSPVGDDQVWIDVIRYVDNGTRTIEVPLPSGSVAIDGGSGRTVGYQVQPILLCTADPTASHITGSDPAGFVWSATGFEGPPQLHTGFLDGTSQTIAFAYKYHRSYQTVSGRTPAGAWVEVRAEVWSSSQAIRPAAPYQLGGPRRATFADAGWGDVVPVTDQASGRTLASVPGMTFQVRPTPESADTRVPHTPFAAGLPVALFDGSVRTLRAGIAEDVFWALVTPRGGEVVGDW